MNLNPRKYFKTNYIFFILYFMKIINKIYQFIMYIIYVRRYEKTLNAANIYLNAAYELYFVVNIPQDLFDDVQTYGPNFAKKYVREKIKLIRTVLTELEFADLVDIAKIKQYDSMNYIVYMKCIDISNRIIFRTVLQTLILSIVIRIFRPEIINYSLSAFELLNNYKDRIL